MNARAAGKIRASSVLAVAAAVVAGVALFWTAQKVQMAEARLQHLREASASEKQAIHVLHAEWDYLNRPDRLEALALQHLKMLPPQAGSVVGSADALAEPAVPPAKPAIKAQPAVLRGPVSTAPVAAPAKPAAPQPLDAGQRSFQDLLNDLDRGKGGRTR